MKKFICCVISIYGYIKYYDLYQMWKECNVDENLYLYSKRCVVIDNSFVRNFMLIIIH